MSTAIAKELPSKGDANRPLLLAGYSPDRNLLRVSIAFEVLRKLLTIYDRKAIAPRSRKQCPRSRPCPWVLCRYHLYLDLSSAFLRLNFPGNYLSELPATCALDVAKQGGCTLEKVGEMLGGLTKERARQIEVAALKKVQVAVEEGLIPSAKQRWRQGR